MNNALHSTFPSYLENSPCILEQIKNTNHLTTWELKPSHSIIKQQTHFLLRLDQYYFFYLIDTIDR